MDVQGSFLIYPMAKQLLANQIRTLDVKTAKISIFVSNLSSW